MAEISQRIVEVAINAYDEATGEGWQLPCVKGMRAALTAALPHLMGEVVAWEVSRNGRVTTILQRPPMEGEADPYDGYVVRPLYAPTNQERGNG